MAATVASASNAVTAKKCPPNIRTGSVPAPVLVSPISVAHGNTMAGSEGNKKGANWMRDQWVANLKKKRMTTDGDAPSTTTTATASAGPVPVVKAGIRAEKASTASSKPKRATKSKTAKAAPTSDVSASVQALEKEGLSLMQSAMFFNDLGCFELESPSFMRLTPSMRDGSGTPLSAMASPAQATAALKTDKKWMKPLVKKRSSCFSAESNAEPKRRTPRRPHSHGGSFDESDSSSQHSYTSVGTPSNFNSADAARMWGPEFDFPNGYVDTFLDLPTPKGAVGGGASGAYLLSTPTALSLMKRTDGSGALEQPKLVRTTSIEQEGLSHFFEQTSLGRSADPSKRSSTSKPSGFWTPRQAAASAVDDYFGKIVPSPAHYAHAHTSARCVQPTPKGTMRHHTHVGGRDCNFDPKKATSNGAHASSSSEFDTLVQEYEFTDFDQELDTFYLDSIESFGSDMDLVSS